MSFLPSAISPDQALVAVVPPSSSGRLIIQIYPVAPPSQVQLTLTAPHQQQQAASASLLRQVLFCGSSAVVARFGTSTIMLWDLDRGVVTQTLQARDEEEFLGLATTSTHFYTLVQHGNKKLVVQEYDGTGKLTRKIKSGRCEGDSSMLAVSDSHVVVQTAPNVLRIMNSVTGKKLDKIKSTNMSMVKLVGVTLIVAQTGGSVVLYDVTSPSKKGVQSTIPQPITEMPDHALSDGILQLSGGKLMLEGTIYIAQDGSKTKYEKLTTMKSNKEMAPFLTGNEKAMVLVHQKQTGCVAQWIELDDVSTSVDLDKIQQEAVAAAKKSGDDDKVASKRKSTEPMMLGPGQAGAEMAAPPIKKTKLAGEGEDGNDENDEEQGPTDPKDITIAERLEQLRNALDDDDEDDEDDDEADMDDADPSSTPKSKFKAHRATTESLKELMSQALQAGDDSLLELALGVQDVNVISTTLAELGNAHIVTLLSKLTARLASNPLRAEGLSLWLSRCLKQGRFQHRHLAPLRNLLYERTESFADLLRLEGRLALMCDVE